MVGITGIEQLAGATPAPAPKGKTAAGNAPRLDTADRVSISAEAVRAAEAARLAAEAESQNNVRTEAIEAARQRLQEGAYRLQSVVLQVAARVGEYV